MVGLSVCGAARHGKDLIARAVAGEMYAVLARTAILHTHLRRPVQGRPAWGLARATEGLDWRPTTSSAAEKAHGLGGMRRA